MTDSASALRARQYYQQGLSFYQRGQLSEATDALQLAVRTAPDHVDARYHLSQVLIKRGRGDEGLRVLDTGLARAGLDDGERARLLEQAAACASATNRYELARHYLEEAISLTPRATSLLNKLGAICCKGGEFAMGFDYLLQAASRRA